MTPFPLYKLPYLPLRDAVDQMNEREKHFKTEPGSEMFLVPKRPASNCRYKLATSSKQLKRIVQTMKFNVFGYMFHMNNIRCDLRVHESEDERHSMAFYKTEDDAKSDETSRFQDSQVHVVPDPIEECLNLTRQYHSIFKVKCRSFDIFLLEDPKETIELIAKILAEGYDFLSLTDRNWPNLEKEVDREVLKYVMDNLKLDAGLSLCGMIPSDFKHEKAFQFNTIIYSHSAWISLNDLKSIRNMKHLEIGRTIFNTSDMNQLLHHWVNCEEDTIEYFSIPLKPGDQIVEEQLFEGLLTVVVENESHSPKKLIKCNSPKKRQFIVASVYFTNWRTVILEGFKSNGKYSSYLSVFDDLEKERDLKKELAGIEQNKKRKEEIEMEIAEIQLRLIDFDF